VGEEEAAVLRRIKMEYNKAIINLFDGRTIEVKGDCFFQRDEKVVIMAENGITYCTSIKNCVLIKG
jgi:hypothetical protein